jgi:ribosome biogenesis GTPase
VAGAPKDEKLAVKVGDDVVIRQLSDKEGVIQKILPRRSKLSRTVEGKAYKEHIIASNIDQMVIISSVSRPPFKPGLLDRYLVIAERNQLKAVICLNKIDLADEAEFTVYAEWYDKLNYPFLFTSVKTGRGIDRLSSVLRKKVSVLVGHSGVGKSSLAKQIEPGLDLRIRETSDKRKKGRHTTSHAELFPLQSGGYLIDTPGIRELGLWDIYKDDLKYYFPEFRQFKDECRFKDCSHRNEPGCAVKQAVEKGEIFEQRYRNYVNIYHDLRAAAHELIKKR